MARLIGSVIADETSLDVGRDLARQRSHLSFIAFSHHDLPAQDRFILKSPFASGSHNLSL